MFANVVLAPGSEARRRSKFLHFLVKKKTKTKVPVIMNHPSYHMEMERDRLPIALPPPVTAIHARMYDASEALGRSCFCPLRGLKM